MGWHLHQKKSFIWFQNTDGDGPATIMSLLLHITGTWQSIACAIIPEYPDKLLPTTISSSLLSFPDASISDNMTIGRLMKNS